MSEKVSKRSEGSSGWNHVQALDKRHQRKIIPQINRESCQLCSTVGHESDNSKYCRTMGIFSKLVKIGPWIVCGYCLEKHEGPEEIDDFWKLFNRCLICNEKSPKDHHLVPSDFYRKRTPHHLGFYFCEDHCKNRCKRCWIETDGYNLCKRCYHNPNLCICCNNPAAPHSEDPHLYQRLCDACYQTRKTYDFYEYYSS